MIMHSIFPFEKGNSGPVIDERKKEGGKRQERCETESADNLFKSFWVCE